MSELVVGADGQNGEAGRVYIKIGPLSPMPSVVWYEIDKPVSPTGLDWFGFRLAAEDMNQDGDVDLVVSAPGVDVDGIGIRQGQVFVFYGPWTFTTPSAPPYASYTSVVEPASHRNNPTSDTFGDRFGYRLAVCDPNHDGNPDLIVGSPYSWILPHQNQNGEAYLFSGPSFSTWSELILPFTTDCTAGSFPHVVDRLWGWDIACGNLTGSVNDDIAVAAYNSDNPPLCFNNGWVRVFVDGNVGAGSIDIQRPGGDINGADFGWSLAVRPFDSDAYADLVVGMPWEGLNAPNGEVQILFGGPAFPLTILAPPVVRPDAGVPGTQPLDKFGLDVEMLNDRDLDGFGEVVIGRRSTSPERGRFPSTGRAACS